jgi:hypothetical protein
LGAVVFRDPRHDPGDELVNGGELAPPQQPARQDGKNQLDAALPDSLM